MKPLPTSRLVIICLGLSALLSATVLRVSDRAELELTRGPYLQQGAEDSVTLRWRTSAPVSSRVRYGQAPDQLEFEILDARTTTNHSITLTGLEPATTYFYSVGTASKTIAGERSDYNFTTSPASGTSPATRVWVIGDSGTADDNARAVRNAFVDYTDGRDPDLWLMLGDNAYGHGTDKQYQAAVFDMYTPLLPDTVLWATLGNHDGHTADSASQSGPYYEIFTLPTQGEAGGLASGTEAYYSFDYGDIHFVCLDSYETERSPDGAMMTWLEQDLAATTKKWIIAFWHHSPYSKGSHNSDFEARLIDMREMALPILESYGVDLVLTGHSHSYERSFLLNGHYGSSATLTSDMILDPGDGRVTGDGPYGKSTVSGEGAVYVVAGSSGKTSGAALDHPAMYIGINTLGSLLLDIDDNRISGSFISATGTVDDTFVLKKGVDESPPAVQEVRAVDSQTTVQVRFSERLAPPSASLPSNYVIQPGITVEAANLASDGQKVNLTTSPLAAGESYEFSVSGVTDVAGNATTSSGWIVQSRRTKTWTFQNGVAPTTAYSGTRDVSLYENNAATPHGDDPTLVIDGDDPWLSDKAVATLLQWDLSSVPRSALVREARIALDVTNDSDDSYEIYALATSWAEADATWQSRSAFQSWDDAGALGPFDRRTELLGVASPSTTGEYVTVLNEYGTQAIQRWIDYPGSNYGLVIASGTSTDGADFSSSEASTSYQRPRLEMTLSLPASLTVSSTSRPEGNTP